MRTGKIWTKDEERYCLKLVRQGKTYQAIADEMGLTKKVVSYYISKKRKEQPRVWKRIHTEKRCTQSCVDCFFGSGAERDGWKCPWADRLEPVPGWDAVSIPYYLHNTQSGVRYDVTFDIKSCPHFDRG